MLIGAGVRNGGGPMRQLGAPLAAAVERNTWAQAGAMRNLWAGEGTVIAGASSANKSGIPDGALHPASWLMPPKAGGMSARYTAALAFDATGLAVGGITTTGTASFVIDFALATGGLIASGTGTAAFSFALAGGLFGVLQGSGAASLVVSTNTPTLGAEASMIGSASWALTATATILPADDTPPARTAAASFAITATLLPYAIGNMSGSTIVSETLTADAVAAATLAALQATTIPVDLQRVRGQALDGAGTSGDPWGPV